MRKTLILIITILVACGSPKNPNQTEILDDVGSSGTEPSISQENMAMVIQQIPSPLEAAVLLKQIDSKYDPDLLNSTENASLYNTSFKKAINLGIYGTDMGYINIFEHTEDAISYLQVIRRLSEDLSIGQFFDFKTIHHLAVNSRNLDSLLLITTQTFNDINDYLQTQNRSKVSILLLSGGWLEALHISSQVYAAHPDNSILKERIGEQKIILNNLILLLSYYNEDAKVNDLLNELNRLTTVFDQIKITYTYEEPEYEVVDGVLKIKDNSSSTIEITDEQAVEINSITKSIRAKIIG